jgi:hypothetical protein
MLSLSSIQGMIGQVSQYSGEREYYNKLVSDAKMAYERDVESSMQRLNDEVSFCGLIKVEGAGRSFDDVCYNNQ